MRRSVGLVVSDVIRSVFRSARIADFISPYPRGDLHFVSRLPEEPIPTPPKNGRELVPRKTCIWLPISFNIIESSTSPFFCSLWPTGFLHCFSFYWASPDPLPLTPFGVRVGVFKTRCLVATEFSVRPLGHRGLYFVGMYGRGRVFVFPRTSSRRPHSMDADGGCWVCEVCFATLLELGSVNCTMASYRSLSADCAGKFA